MSYLASKLIANAYYLSGVVSRDSQTVTGTQVEDGIDMLNFLISDKSGNYKQIPYFNSIDITSVIGQEKYFVPNLLEVENVTFDIGSVRYPLFYLNRNAYFGTPVAKNIKSLMCSYHNERTLGGTDIYFRFLPNDAYEVHVWGKFGFDSVELTTDLTVAWELYYINYIMFCLAEYICAFYNKTFSEQSSKLLRSMEQRLSEPSPTDLTMKRYSAYVGNSSFGYGMANLGNGFYPG
jgi:hypothetical protein